MLYWRHRLNFWLDHSLLSRSSSRTLAVRTTFWEHQLKGFPLHFGSLLVIHLPCRSDHDSLRRRTLWPLLLRRWLYFCNWGRGSNTLVLLFWFKDLEWVLIEIWSFILVKFESELLVLFKRILLWDVSEFRNSNLWFTFSVVRSGSVFGFLLQTQVGLRRKHRFYEQLLVSLLACWLGLLFDFLNKTFFLCSLELKISVEIDQVINKLN